MMVGIISNRLGLGHPQKEGGERGDNNPDRQTDRRTSQIIDLIALGKKKSSSGAKIYIYIF